MACCSLMRRWTFRMERKWSYCCACGSSPSGGGEFAHGGWFQDVGAVKRVALRGPEAGVGDDAAKLFFVGAVPDARGEHHVFLNQNAADVVGAKLQANLANLDARREPARLDVIDVVEIQAADRERLQIIDGGGFLHLLAERRIFRRENPRDESREATGFFLKLADPVEMIHAVLQRFAA